MVLDAATIPWGNREIHQRSDCCLRLDVIGMDEHAVPQDDNISCDGLVESLGILRGLEVHSIPPYRSQSLVVLPKPPPARPDPRFRRRHFPTFLSIAAVQSINLHCAKNMPIPYIAYCPIHFVAETVCNYIKGNHNQISYSFSSTHTSSDRPTKRCRYCSMSWSDEKAAD